MHTLVADLLVTSKEDRDFELNQAVAAATTKALKDRQHGVLVTRHDFSHYTVALTTSVPFGQIHESDQVSTNGVGGH